MLKKLMETAKYLTKDQLILNANETEIIFFLPIMLIQILFLFNGENTKEAHACRSLGVQIDTNLTFESNLPKPLIFI